MAHTETATARPDAERGETVVYIYGVVPADVEEDPSVTGVGDPPRPVRLVRSGPIAALVAEIPSGTPLGTPEDLTAHARVLDSAATEVPVIPLRFGAVVTDLGAVAAEFLEPNGDLFKRALQALEGRVQFTLRGRYVEQEVLREVLSQDAQAARLREEIQGKPPEAVHDARVALGERVGRAVELKRQDDSRAAASRIEAYGFPIRVGAPTHEWDALNVSCLVDMAEEKRLRALVSDLAAEQKGRMTLRLLGPMAAYDFVPSGPEG